MLELATVNKIISDNLVEVAINRSKACGKCCACKPVGNEIFSMRAINDVGAKIGDPVEVEYASTEILKATFVVFLLPIVLLVLGYLIGNRNGEKTGVFVGLLFLVLGLIVARYYDLVFNKRSGRLAKITRIVLQ